MEKETRMEQVEKTYYVADAKEINMMNVTVEKKKEEALARMKQWKIFPQVVRDYKNEDLICQSEPPVGACYYVDKWLLDEIREFEENNNSLVYHVIRSFTEFGEMYSFLYVSDYEEEWEMDWADIAEGQQICYIYNKDMPDCSEAGTIGIQLTRAAGLARVW